MRFTNQDRAEIISQFIKGFPGVVKSMIECSHGLGETPSPFHLEGSVWAHTMMVVANASTRLGTIACLVHDIGKPFTRTERVELNKVKFSGHEGYGFFMIDEILDSFDLSIEEKNSIKVAVALHGRFRKASFNEFVELTHGFSEEIMEVLIELLDCDSKGRHCLDDGIWEHDGYEILMSGVRDSKKHEAATRMQYNSERGSIHVLIGLPAAGKSSYLSEMEIDGTVISRDQLIEEMGVGSNYEEKWAYFDKNRRAKKELDKVYNAKVLEALSRGGDIVIDNTNLTLTNRAKFSSMINKGYNVEGYVFLSNLDEIKDRNRKREGKYVANNVIDNMAKRFVFPLYDEFNKIHLI